MNKSLSVSDLPNLRHGQILFHKTLKNADNTPLRCRVNGKLKTWKTNSNFRLPVKYGLKNCFYITEGNMKDWNIS